MGQGAVQRELARLAEAGLLVRTRVGSQVHFQANAASPVFGELKTLMVKTAGVGDVLREALAGLADRITLAFVYGSLARGEGKANSDVDVMIIGEVSFGEVVSGTAIGAENHRAGGQSFRVYRGGIPSEAESQAPFCERGREWAEGVPGGRRP